MEASKVNVLRLRYFTGWRWDHTILLSLRLRIFTWLQSKWKEEIKLLSESHWLKWASSFLPWAWFAIPCILAHLTLIPLFDSVLHLSVFVRTLFHFANKINRLGNARGWQGLWEPSPAYPNLMGLSLGRLPWFHCAHHLLKDYSVGDHPLPQGQPSLQFPPGFHSPTNHL